MKYVHLERVSPSTFRLSTCLDVEELSRFLRRLEGDDVEFVIPGTFPFKTVKRVDEVRVVEEGTP